MGRMGETKRISMVPISFSRAMDIEVIIAVISISKMVITPGTNIKTLFRAGLYIICDSVVMVTGSDSPFKYSCW